MTVARPLPCIHLGRQLEHLPRCKGRLKHVCDEGHGVVCPITECQTCNDYVASDGSRPAPQAPPAAEAVGVVIGAWRSWSAVRLNLAAIRHTCGPVRVLVVEDYATAEASAEGDAIRAQMRAAAEDYGATFFGRGDRVNLGHGQGDLNVFNAGLYWARALGLRVLAKLSQRYVITRPRWLQEAAQALLKTGLPVGCDRGKHHSDFWGLRTEAILLDVAQWHQNPHAMELIRPRPLWPQSAEEVVSEAAATFAGGWWVWPLLGGYDRRRWTPQVLWYTAGEPDQYQRAAAELGVTLGPDFYLSWSSQVPGYSRG